MNLRQLQALLAVSEFGGFTAAAIAMHTVQSNVSAHVARLETELAVVLVDRSNGALTAAGELVVSRARRIEAELDALSTDVASLHHQVVGVARVGMISTTARWLLPPLLKLAAQRHPSLRVEATEGTASGLEPLLAMGRLDLTVGPSSQSESDLDFVPLFDEQLMLVVPVGDPMAELSAVSLEDLAGLPLLLPLPGTSFRDTLDAAAAAAGTKLEVLAEVDGTRLLASLTFDGHGPAILPATALPQHLRPTWRLVAVKDLGARRVGVLQRRRGLPSVAARATLDLLFELTSSEADLPYGLSSLPRRAATR
jgi:DNA-binding transcriptional LysR family regulator